MHLDEPADDRQSDAEPRMLSPRPFCLLAEHVEHVRQELRGDALSGAEIRTMAVSASRSAVTRICPLAGAARRVRA